jgi:poly(3-hydroxybutyrate) depolymerase
MRMLILALFAALGFACGSSSAGMGVDIGPSGSDANASDNGSGGPSDTGSGSMNDTGGAFDAGTGARMDSGGAQDTGIHPDAGSPEPDAGTGPTDSGTGPEDSGTGPVDSGMTGSNRSAGCGMGQTPGTNELSIMVNGQTRTYFLSVPQGYDPNTAHPLVFGMHGLTGSGMSIRTRGVEMEEAMNTAVFVYPDGLPQPAFQNQTGWNLDPAGPDFAFVDTLIQTLEGEFCVDENRVFAYGFSFGGYMSHGLGCYRSNKFRAIGPVEGALASQYGPCMGPTAAVMNHIMDDPTVTIQDGTAARDHWLTANGCDPNSTVPYAPIPSGPGFTCVAYQNCQPAHPVVWCLTQTGGHSWPDPPANLAIWSFFTMLQ